MLIKLTNGPVSQTTTCEQPLTYPTETIASAPLSHPTAQAARGDPTNACDGISGRFHLSTRGEDICSASLCSVTLGLSCRQRDLPEAGGPVHAASDGADAAVQVRGLQHVPPL